MYFTIVFSQPGQVCKINSRLHDVWFFALFEVSFKHTTHQDYYRSWCNWGKPNSIAFMMLPKFRGEFAQQGTFSHEVTHLQMRLGIQALVSSVPKANSVFHNIDAALAKCIFSTMFLSTLF